MQNSSSYCEMFGLYQIGVVSLCEPAIDTVEKSLAWLPSLSNKVLYVECVSSNGRVLEGHQLYERGGVVDRDLIRRLERESEHATILDYFGRHGGKVQLLCVYQGNVKYGRATGRELSWLEDGRKGYQDVAGSQNVYLDSSTGCQCESKRMTISIILYCTRISSGSTK